jgi:Zn-dependent protease with chaperone function
MTHHPSSSASALQDPKLPADYRRNFDLLPKLDEPLPQNRVSLSYRIGIVVVSILMVLLPLIYLAIIGLVAYVVYYHAVHHIGMLGAVKGRGVILAALAYATPLIAGVTIVLFMLKPIFARREEQEASLVLKSHDEPLLFEFVARICRAVRAPVPTEIVLDHTPNASASFRRGAWSMFSNDLRLTIGAPLAAGLTAQEFAGVLAHEFGHFAQGAGMRLSYLIRTISLWLTHAVYQRDKWDEWLVNSCQGDLQFTWVVYVTRGLVWLTRRVLWVLMYAGHLVSSYLLRQMEFDADRYQTHVVGSECFAKTFQRLPLLVFGHRMALQDLSEFYREGRLGNDLAQLIQLNVSKMDDGLRTKIQEMHDADKTGWLDTHPSIAERVASSRRSNARGTFHEGRPATVLFRDFDAVSQDSTLLFYREIFGGQLDLNLVHDVHELVEKQRIANLAFESLNRVTQGSYNFRRPLELGRRDGISELPPTQAIQELKQWRAAIERTAGPYESLREKWAETEDARVLVAQASLLQQAGFKVPKQLFNPPLVNAQQCDALWESTNQKRAELDPQMKTHEESLAHRINLTLGILATATEDEFPGRELLVGIGDRMLSSYKAMRGQVESILSIRERFVALSALFESGSSGGQNPPAFPGTLQRVLEETATMIAQLRGALADRPYPFDHAQTHLSIGEFLIADAPAADDVGGLANTVENLLEEFPRLYVRVFGQICWVCEQVETWLDLPLSAEPKPE